MAKQTISAPVRKPGEDDKTYHLRVEQWFREGKEMPKNKGDLKGWTGSYPFHLDRQND